MAGSPILLDTSLIVAASVRLHPDYKLAREYIEQLSAREIPTCLSPQVCREFLVVLTRQAVAGLRLNVATRASIYDNVSSDVAFRGSFCDSVPYDVADRASIYDNLRLDVADVPSHVAD